MPEDYVSPVVMEVVRRAVDGDPEKGSLYTMVEVRMRSDDEKPGKLLATCMMSDDSGLERIADGLAAKRLWREANRFRQMVQQMRRR
jgi:hypothetical protein